MKLICFDLDNTLIDSEKAHIKAYNEALEKNGFKKAKIKDLLNMMGMPHLKLIRRLTKEKNKKILKKVSADHSKAIIKKYHKYAKALSGTITTLKKLKKKYKLAIVSNTTHKEILCLLKGAKINKNYFNLIIGNDEVKYSKPYPDEILKAEKLIHHKAEFIIGDSIYDIIAGKKAKVKTIAITSGRYTKNKLKKEKPTYIVKKIRDILKII